MHRRVLIQSQDQVLHVRLIQAQGATKGVGVGERGERGGLERGEVRRLGRGTSTSLTSAVEQVPRDDRRPGVLDEGGVSRRLRQKDDPRRSQLVGGDAQRGHDLCGDAALGHPQSPRAEQGNEEAAAAERARGRQCRLEGDGDGGQHLRFRRLPRRVGMHGPEDRPPGALALRCESDDLGGVRPEAQQIHGVPGSAGVALPDRLRQSSVGVAHGEQERVDVEVPGLLGLSERDLHWAEVAEHRLARRLPGSHEPHPSP